MSLRRIEPGESLGSARGHTVVCIPVFGAHDVFAVCLRSVLDHTPADITILVADDASPGPDIQQLTAELLSRDGTGHDVAYFRQPSNVGFVANMNAAFAAAKPADVVILNSDCVVGEAWLDGLRAAAYSDGTIATASALTNNGTILSIPHRNQPLPDLPKPWTVDDAARAVRRASLQLRPRIPTAIGHCVYVRRSALELVGTFDLAFSPGYEEEVDFSQRCVLRGLCHVVADDVFVLHRGGASFRARPVAMRTIEAHQRLIASRYPYYHRTVDETAAAKAGPLAQALRLASRALLGCSITIDASCLGPDITGTQIHALELIHALWRKGGVQLRIAVPRNIGGYARRALAQMDGVETIVWEDVGPRTRLTDVVHRAYQVTNIHEVKTLDHLGERVIITQQDLIAFRNPGYFPNAGEWRRYRQVTRQALALADRILFFSHHAASQAIAEQIVDAERARVVYIGTDHRLQLVQSAPRPPQLLDGLDPGEFILCLGTDFRHKNRVFALQVLARLQQRHGWNGQLILAGPRVAFGSSVEEEERFLAQHPQVAAATRELRGITEEEKAWLLARARLMIYPTLQEGFGLVPFEAARAGVPCLFAAQTSLAEILPPEAGLIVPWDADATADQAMVLLRDPAKRTWLLELIKTAGERLTWAATAEGLFTAYDEAVKAPARRVESINDAGEIGGGPVAAVRFAARRSLWLWRTYGMLDGSRRVARGVGRRVGRQLSLIRPASRRD